VLQPEREPACPTVGATVRSRSKSFLSAGESGQAQGAGPPQRRWPAEPGAVRGAERAWAADVRVPARHRERHERARRSQPLPGRRRFPDGRGTCRGADVDGRAWRLAARPLA